jgi:PIN domain nuclease of toxin-antitoxin system
MALFTTDTHPLIWYAEGQHARLSRAALRIFDDALDERALIYVPAVVMLEVSMLHERGRVELGDPFDLWASRLLARSGFDLVPLDLEVVTEASYLSFSHDPFDRAIVATARLKDAPLITRDRAITDAGLVEIAW